MANIIQPDNAVIDYSTISVIIDTLNAQQKAIVDLQQSINHTSTSYDANGNKVTQTGTQSIQGGYVPITTKTVTVNYSFTGKPSSVIGVVQSANGVPAYAYINSTISNTEAKFTIVANSITKNMNLYWIAVGIK